MLFQTTQAHEELRAKVRAFAEEEIKPIAFMLDQQNEFPDEAIRKLGEMGLMGIPYPKEYGGAGGDVLSYAMCVEELAKVCGTTAVIVSAHTSLCCAPIYEHGTEEQKMKYLPDLLSGKKIGAFGLTEPNAGTDASGQQTLAVLEGDHYVLNGSKCFITNGNVADTFVIIAVTGKTTDLMGASSATLLNALKRLAGIDHQHHLISREAIEPIQAVKVNHLGSVNPRLHSDETLIALAISATTNPPAPAGQAGAGSALRPAGVRGPLHRHPLPGGQQHLQPPGPAPHLRAPV